MRVVLLIPRCVLLVRASVYSPHKHRRPSLLYSYLDTLQA